MIRTLTIIVFSFAAGAFAWAMFDKFLVSAYVNATDPYRIEEHWRIVNDYRERMTNPKYRKALGASGMTYVDVTVDPEPSLAALAAADELVHLDLVLPKVPTRRETTRHWLKWADGREGLIQMLGHTRPPDVLPNDYPLHVNMWYLHRLEPEVQQLIKELEALADALAAKGILENTLKAPTPGVERPLSAPEVPPHDKRDRFLGAWGSEGEVEFWILEREDQSVFIRDLMEFPWSATVNNVRWEGDDLHYDFYVHFAADADPGSLPIPKDFSMRSRVVLQLTDDPERLRVTFSSDDLEEPEQYDCFRISADRGPK